MLQTGRSVARPRPSSYVASVTQPQKKSRRRILNLPLMIGSFVGIALLGIGGYAWHNYQLEQTATIFLERAEQLDADGKPEKAAAYLHRYLQLHPEDRDARVQLAQVYRKAVTDEAGKARAAELYYRAMGLVPNNMELRKELGVLLIELGRYQAAYEQAESILEEKPNDLPGLKLRAQALYGKYHNGGSVTKATVSQSFEDYLSQDPGNVELAAVLAAFYRENWKGEPSFGAEKKADRIIDRLLEVNPDSVDALLTRFQYRRLFQLDGGESDLQGALEMDPNHYQGHVAAADYATQREEFETAQHHYQRAIELKPEESAAYLGLGKLWRTQNEPAQAIDFLRTGIEKSSVNPLELHFELAEALFESEAYAEVEEEITSLRKVLKELRPKMVVTEWENHQTKVGQLEARYLMSQGEFHQAVDLLSSLVLSRDLKTEMLLGNCYLKLQQWDLAADTFEQAVQIDPAYAPARISAAKSRVAANRPDLAIQHYQHVIALQNSPESHFQYARALFEEQCRKPKWDRNWDQFEQAISTALSVADQNHLEDAWRVHLLNMTYQLMKTTSENPATALIPELKQLEAEYGDSEALWKELAVIYETFGLTSSTDRALKHYQELTPHRASGTILAAQITAGRDGYDGAERLLEQALPFLTPEEQVKIRREWAVLATKFSKTEEAVKQWESIHRIDPKNLEALSQLAQSALQAGHIEATEHWEEKLMKVEGERGTHWRFHRAQRLLQTNEEVDSPGFREAMKLLAFLQQERPSWSAASLLKAQVAQRQGFIDRAIDAYQMALHQGDRQLPLFEQLISLLYEQERFAEAERHLAMLEGEIPHSPTLSSLAISVASQRGNLDSGLEVAKKRVKNQPKDLMARIWLGQLLLKSGDSQGAEEAFLEAHQMAPEDARSWVALYTYYLQSGEQVAARDLLTKLTEETHLQPARKSFILGQGYEKLGDRDKARHYYRSARQQAPEDANVHLEFARFMLSEDTEQAETALREVLRLEPTRSEARRLLARLLAERGGSQAWSEAQRLLSIEEGNTNQSPLDLRLQAVLLAQRGGQENVKQSRQILEQLLEQPQTAIPADRLLLAKLLEQEGREHAARQQYVVLIGRSDPQPEHVIAYLDFLFRNGHTSEIDHWLTKLERVEPDALITLAYRCKLLHTRGDLTEIERRLNSYLLKLQDSTSDKTQLAQTMVQIGKLYRELEMYDASDRTFAELMELVPYGYGELALNFANQDRLNEAIDLCLQAAQQDQTVRPALYLATVLTIRKGTVEQYQQAEPLFQQTMEQFPRHVDLLLRIANMRVQEGKSEQAMALYRELLSIQPDHVIAMNNLATLLGEKIETREEALAWVDRALESAGNHAELLDTKGMLLVHLNRAEEAIPVLMEATLLKPVDPRYHFHLAVAYHKQVRLDEAAQAFQQAREKKLDRSVMTSEELDLLNQLTSTLSVP
ncbi:Hypothetical protein PBC10988_35370 [Planctomycetales bacterium 10988]|nr:Hypothetical protein PBC10988_35370 [Planctomycetales bacterium 10988]